MLTNLTHLPTDSPANLAGYSDEIERLISDWKSLTMTCWLISTLISEDTALIRSSTLLSGQRRHLIKYRTPFRPPRNGFGARNSLRICVPGPTFPPVFSALIEQTGIQYGLGARQRPARRSGSKPCHIINQKELVCSNFSFHL